MKIAIVSGYFNPFHVGHLEYFKAARELADMLVVIVNNDIQVGLKGSRVFMDQDDRCAIVEALEIVDYAFMSIDVEDRSCCKTLAMVVAEGQAWKNPTEYLFVNGGDQTIDTIPEVEVCRELGIEMVFGVVPQIRQSSEILKAVEDE